MTLFARSAFRPEVIGAAADQVRFDFSMAAKDVPARFAAAVDEQIQAGDIQMLRVVHGLTPLQSAVLRVMAARGKDFAPFEAETLGAYLQVLHAIAPSEQLEPDTSNVQQALAALQEKALVWRERRGVYALEEGALADLMQSQGLLAMVPPVDPKPPQPRGG